MPVGRSFWRVGIALIAVAIASSTSIPAAASTEESKSEPGFIYQTVPGGGFVAWASTSYLAKHPQPIDGVTTKFSFGSNMQTQDAFGCDNQVCIDIQGDGEYVNKWGTQAFGNFGCMNAIFEDPGGHHVSQPQVCPYSPSEGVYYDYTGPIGYFNDGDKLCNEWTGIPWHDQPCKYIEA